MDSLADTYRAQKKLDEAEALCREILEIRRRVLGEEHRYTLQTQRDLAYAWQDQGRFVEAEDLQRETLAIFRRAHGESHRTTNNQRYSVACVLAVQGRRDEAVAFLRDALDNGFQRASQSIHDDPDLTSLHGDPDFEAIVEELKRRNEDSGPTTVEEGRSEGTQ